MQYACLKCGKVWDREPEYVKEQEEKYSRLKREWEKLEEKCEKINEKWFYSKKYYLKDLLWAPISFMGVLSFCLAFVYSLAWIGVAVALWLIPIKIYFDNFWRFVKKRDPQLYNDTRIYINSDRLRIDPKFDLEVRSAKWNYRFFCENCETETLFWIHDQELERAD